MCDLLPFGCTPTFDHMDVPFSHNSASLPQSKDCSGWPAQGVGLFSVMCYVLYFMKHDALAQQLCGFVSCSSQGIDQMQCECHGSWHSQKSDVFLIISRTTQRVRGSTSSCSCVGRGWPYVCMCSMRYMRLLCCRSVHHACVHACLNC